MLQALTIRDFVIVEHLDLEFEQGFTTLTGETGAGKSILIDALSLSLGARSDGVVTRAGCDKAEIMTTFDVKDNAAVQAWFAENEMDAEDTLILRRVLYADGRSRAFLNGVASTVAQLKNIGQHLIDIYSQNAHHSLMHAHTQRDILDGFGGHAGLRKEVATNYVAWHDLNTKKRAAEKNAAAYAEELAVARDRVQELKRLGFSLDDWQQLQQEHSRLANGASLLNGVEACLAVLDTEEQNTNAMLSQVQVRLSELMEYDTELKEVAEGIDAAVIHLDESTRALNRYLQDADLDPQRLNVVEAEIQAVHQAARKYRVNPEELPSLLAQSETRVAELEMMTNDGELMQAEKEAYAAYLAAAKVLSEKRAQAADALGEAITEEMQRLSLGGGRFAIALRPVDPSQYGGEVIDFLVAGHAGVDPRPLNKVASGGELSRISLALHVTTASKGSVPCMIFDEVDVGIGGGVAEVVGQLLKQLGQQRQVLVITHLAQVASQAAQHLQVSKTQEHDKTLSHIKALDDEARIQEIARMIGGLDITPATIAHAKEMLQKK